MQSSDSVQTKVFVKLCLQIANSVDIFVLAEHFNYLDSGVMVISKRRFIVSFNLSLNRKYKREVCRGQFMW